MKLLIVATTVALAISAYWITEELECLIWSAGTDTCVHCTDDYLEPMEGGV